MSRTHGHCSGPKRHPLYGVWGNMIARCHRPTERYFHRYGGRGITVCERWRTSFSAFLADMGPRPEGMTLDRRDNDGPYSPENCRWATPLEQAANQSGHRVRLTVSGETHTATEWARIRGLDPFTILRRVLRGWSAERAVLTPVRRHGKPGEAYIAEALGDEP